MDRAQSQSKINEKRFKMINIFIELLTLVNTDTFPTICCDKKGIKVTMQHDQTLHNHIYPNGSRIQRD